MEDITEGKSSITAVLLISVCMSVLGGSFQYGYNIAVMNAPSQYIKQYYFEEEVTTKISNETTTSYLTNTSSSIIENDKEVKYSDGDLLIWAITISIFTVGGIIGSSLVGFFTQKFGRKKAQLYSSSLSFTAGAMMLLSKPANSLIMIIIARFFLGIFSGLATGMVPLYISEIAPKHIRGALGVVNQLAITIGILSAQILGLKELFGTEDLWNVLLFFTCVPSMFQVLILSFMPESPRYLLIDKHQRVAAINALVRLRGHDEVDNEIKEMEDESAEKKDEDQATIIEVLKNKNIKWQMRCICTLHVVQQLSGINAIFFYLNDIFEAAGVEEETQSYASCAVGAVNVFMTIVSVLLTEKAGRKKLIWIGYAITSVFCVLMTISLNLQDQITWISSISIVSVIGFIIGFAIGPGPIPWIQQTEFFEQSMRPAAGSFATALNWMSNFILSLLFPFMIKFLGPYVFIFFLVICVFGCVFTYKYVPETKNKTFQEIGLLFDELNGIKKAGYDEVQLEDRS